MSPGRSTTGRRPVRLLACSTVLAVGAMGVQGAVAQDAASTATPSAGARADLDSRFDGIELPPSAAALRAIRALGDVEVGWTRWGTPHSLRSRSGALTGPSKASPDAVARGFLRAQRALFGQSPADVDRLRLVLADPDASGTTFLRYQQVHGARDVHDARVLVVVDAARRVVFVGGNLAPSLGAVTPPVLTAERAVERASTAFAVRGSARTVSRLGAIVDGVSTTTFRNTFAVPALRHPEPVVAKLVTVPSATGGRTAWSVRADVASNADYEVLVDATTGAVIYRKNQWSHSEPHGLVHTGDDPEAGGQVADVLFSGIDGTWVDGQTTAGNNVNAFQDLFDDETPDAADQPSNADQHFDYPWTDPWGTSATLPTAGAERDATVTQLFYYTNWWHDYAYGLGFTETANNFQNDNFGRGGTGGDAVSAESDDSYADGVQKLCDDDGTPVVCRNNANFNSNGPDGTVPRMQMYVGDDGRRTQRANNRDTVIHEYAHGITGRTISNGNLAGSVQSGALGEGWSDAFATSVNNDPVYGEYNNGNYTTGIRGVAYDQDSLEYGDLCNNAAPADPCQVHDDGRIWAMAMWEARAALIGKLGFDAGKALHERLLMLGIKSTPDTPSYHDARTGYLAADVLTTPFDPGDTNQCLIWRTLADNELGVTAGPDSDSQQNPTVSTATPEECSPTAAIAGLAAGPEGTDVELDGTASSVGGDPGDVPSYAWDLDNDGQYDDSTSATPSFTDVGTDGSFPVSLQVTNTAGYTDTADATITLTNVAPVITDLAADGPKPEGSALTVSGLVKDPGFEDDLSLTVDWGDGSPVEPVLGAEEQVRPDATLGFTTSHRYGDNGSYDVELCAADDDTTSCTTLPVSITNVAPSVTIDPAQLAAVVENQGLSVAATFSDPGWLDTYTATVDDGTGSGPQPADAVVTGEGGPGVPDTGTVTGAVLYGDNGTWTVEVRVTDDDGGSTPAAFDVTVANVDPTTTIDETGTVLINGVPTFMADVNVPVPFSTRALDPGSDDLTTTWDWDDGAPAPDESQLSRVNPPADDPAQSPSVQPRDVTHSTSHAFGLACMYDVTAGVRDDDGGTGSDMVKTLITGAPTLSRGAGYWQTAYKGTGGAGFSDQQKLCYLEIAAHLSTVFNEVRDASTIAKAYDDIFVAGKNGSMSQQLDRELLASWLNFANGGVEYTELLDTNGDLLPDSTFIDLMTSAEAVRLDPAATRAQLETQKNRLVRVSGRDGV